MTARIKRLQGRYFTDGNPFDHAAFLAWARDANIRGNTILEPFAGANTLIRHLQGMDLCSQYESFDITPGASDVQGLDTISNFPTGFDVCITNPPWLAKNSATVRGMPFPECPYDDLYKLALEKCLWNCDWVAALIPESFIRANIFQKRLASFVSITSRLFEETGHPVGLALFHPYPVHDVRVWSGQDEVGLLSELESRRPHKLLRGPKVSFNEPDGNVGLIALDNTESASIRFCDVEELRDYQVKPSGRHITKIQVDGEIRIPAWNGYLDEFRKATYDVLMTCYKGIRKDGMYRRRLDWNLARGIIHHALSAAA